MSKEKSNNKKSFCCHKKTVIEKTTNSKNNLYDYCTECGSISINYNDKFYYTLKPMIKQKVLEVDPIKVVRDMKKNEKKNYPYLDNAFNINPNEKESKKEEIKERILLYLSRRKFLLLYLQNITKLLNYSDLSFYHCLLITDLYLSHNITEEMSYEELLYILLGFFLIASKFKETDIFEPELYIFCNFDEEFNLSVNKILKYEVKCLKNINYDFFIYSTYDWLNIFMGIGYIFEGEINEDNLDEINEIHSYTFKLLITITPRSIFIKYSPLHNAITIIHICREDKIDKNKINNELFNKLLSLFNIKFEEYKPCYEEIKSITDKNNIEKKNQNSNKNQALTSKKEESKNTIEIITNHKNYKSCEKDMNGNNKTGNKIINIDSQRNFNNLKQKLRDNKFQVQLFPSSDVNNEKRKFGSINPINNKQNNKLYGLTKKQKTLQLLEYVDGNLPKIKNMGVPETNKALITEGGSNRRMLTIRNDIFSNYLLKNKKNKNKSGISLDINNFYDNGNPFSFNGLLRNVTYDALKNTDKKMIKKFNKNNINLGSNRKNYKILNKSSDALKYDTKVNININNDNIILESKKREENYKSLNKLNNINYINIYKKNNGINNFNRNITSDNLETNNIKIIKPEKSINVNEYKNNNGINTINDNQETKNSSKEKNNFNLISNKNKKIKLSNIKYNRSNLNNVNDLLALKKLIFKNSRLPTLKSNIK